jgi:Rod binding domain-containing protein
MSPLTPLAARVEGLAPRFSAEAMKAAKPTTEASEAARSRKLRQAAEDFESILIASWWKSMKESFLGSDESEEGFANLGFDELSIQAVSSALAASGGFGIARLLLRQLEPELSSTQPENQAGKAPDGSFGIRAIEINKLGNR